MNKQSSNRFNLNPGVTRRKFIGTTAATSAALLGGGLTSFLSRSALAAHDFDFLEKSIPELQAAMASGQVTSKRLVMGYVNRIQSLNSLLHSVIETNPNAISIAQHLDNERRRGQVRGPLHGIPILVKDNIATDDNMQTTAGSLALVNSHVPGDAVIIQRLREAGAVILGKANLGEWANFRGFDNVYPLAVGWSARGGNTINAYDLSYTSWGSSSGSANGVAANLCSVAVGTETDGSITGPSAVENIVGLKPTVGLVSQDGIIPIAHQQDTAGPMARSVTDVAILLGALQTPFGSVAGASLPPEYTQFLRRGALRGARIGVDRKFFTLDFGGEAPFDAVAEHAIEVMRSLGATIVDPVDSGNPNLFGQAEFTVLLFEFKTQIAQYLANLNHTSMRTLADLITFNEAHCPQEMKFYGQEIFEMVEETSGDLTDPDYVAARTLCVQLSRAKGIDAAIQAQQLDAIVTPTWSFGTSLPAVAGYPNISVPVAIADDGRPAGIWMYSGFLQEPKLLALAYDLEQEIQPRVQPRFAGTPPDWADAGVCESLPKPHDRGHIWKNKPLRPNW